MPATTTSDIPARAVGEEIRRARHELGLTQRAFAERLGTHQTYVANVEAGRENLTLGKLAQVASTLGASLDIRLAVVPRAPVEVPEPAPRRAALA